MRWYRDITYCENARRLETLNKFRANVVSYFDRSRSHWQAVDRIEEPDAEPYRRAINLSLNRVHDILYTAGVPMLVQHQEPPLQGGRVQNLNIVINVFQLHQFQIPHTRLLDLLDQGIGT